MRAASLFLPIFFLGGARAQDLLTEGSCSELSAAIPAFQAASPLEFSVRFIQPHLTYAFRFQAGYSIGIPFSQFVGTGNSIRVVAKVAPTDVPGPPVCFVQVKDLPAVPEGAKPDIELVGGFFLGEGSYHIDLTVSDQRGRLSRKGLNLTAARKGRERQVRLSLEPGSIQTVSGLAWNARPPRASGEPRRVTVLFHAASLYGPRTVLSLYDQGQLLSSLTSVLSEGRFDEVRLIAFNLDQQRELFRRDRFGVEDFHGLAETLPSVNRVSIPVAALEQGQAHLGFLKSLLRDEMSAGRRPAALVFLGPYTDEETKWKDLPCDSTRASPPMFYFQHRVNVARTVCLQDVVACQGGAMWLSARPTEARDTLEHLVRGCSGEVYRIHNPAELDAAIKKLNAHFR
ncbi:MAG TPA: hypothetical protein VN893_11905 [Bryobacteraceae bacterium]|nr:hypothetical protein [Bryobacteraceae bacterium]